MLITTCSDNSEFLGVMTLKLPGRFFSVYVFRIRKQITVSIYFPLHFNLVGDLFVLPHLLHAN